MTLKQKTQWAFVATFIMALIMRFQGKLLLDRGFNIVKFELAGTLDKAQLILNAWNTEGVATARINTYIDFAFILAYVSLGYFTSLLITQNRGMKKMGRWMAIGMIIAGILDCIENVAMLQTLNGVLSENSVGIAYICAAVKFGIILSVIVLAIIIVLLKKKPSQN